jgi:hypothetical protein
MTHYDLEFRRGGTLIYNEWVYDEEKGEGEYFERDLTHNLDWLHKRDRFVKFADDVTLYDLFLFVERDPEVCDIVFTNCFIKEYVKAFKKAQIQFHQSRILPEPSDDDIEYLEVYWVPEVGNWEEGRTTIDSLDRAWFHGIGVIRKEDSEHYKAGERTHWGIDFSPLINLLHLPVRLNSNFELRDDMHLDKYRGVPWQDIPILFKGHREFTFMAAMEAVFWELSFAGTEEDKAEEKNKLDAIMDDLDLTNNTVDDLIAQGKVKDLSLVEELNEGYNYHELGDNQYE